MQEVTCLKCLSRKSTPARNSGVKEKELRLMPVFSAKGKIKLMDKRRKIEIGRFLKICKLTRQFLHNLLNSTNNNTERC